MTASKEVNDLIARLRAVQHGAYNEYASSVAKEAADTLATLSAQHAVAVPDGLPDNCDGKEQYAFEEWAKAQRYEMHEHPLHYIFLDPKTNAARMGWNAAVSYCRKQVLAAIRSREVGE